VTLRGIVGRGRNGSANIANSTGKNVTIGQGDTVEGIKLLEIEKNGVVLEFEGEHRTLRVGDKTQ
jgi:type II secretory pathway component PulC